MSDRARVLDRLRRGPVHSTEIRRTGLSGNPSQRINELREEGHKITAESKPWKDGNGKQRPGTLYTLTDHVEVGGDSGEGTSPHPVQAPPPLGGQDVAVDLSAEPGLFAVEAPVETDRYRDVWEDAA